MPDRYDLHVKLEIVIGSKYLYFQPPETIKLQYPCIIYKLSGVKPKKADNSLYCCDKQYTVIIIDKNPDSKLPDKLLNEFPLCSLSTVYNKDNLNHWVFTIFHNF